jgi:predicted ABC-type ATPase
MPSLIKSIAVKNFKGFSEEVRIDLRPITLLFGANSAGKSSVLHALQYVREILERNNANADRTAQGGEAIDLGGFMNLVHGRSVERQIEVEVEMVLGDSSIPELVPDAFEDWQTQEEEVWSFYNSLHEIRNKVERVSVRLTIGWNSLREEPVVVGYEVGTNGAWCARLEASGDGRDTRMRLNRENPIFMVPAPDADALLAGLDDWVSPQDLEAETNTEEGAEEVASNTPPAPAPLTGVPMKQGSVLPTCSTRFRKLGWSGPARAFAHG